MSAENLDLALDVGDIIYGWGTDTLAQNEAKYDGFFATTASLTASVPLYMTAGNHESISSANSRAGYKREFTLPVNNGADAASNGELYYSFDNGDTHFIALATEIPGQEGLITGNQNLWLQQDLAANTQAMDRGLHAPAAILRHPCDRPLGQYHECCRPAEQGDSSMRSSVRTVWMSFSKVMTIIICVTSRTASSTSSPAAAAPRSTDCRPLVPAMNLQPSPTSMSRSMRPVNHCRSTRSAQRERLWRR